jgi:uncharacterized membrane protein YfcA
MDVAILIILALVGCGIAMLASMVGIAGAIFFLPLMILGFMFPANVAIGASTVAGALSTTTASIQYLIKKKVNFRLALIFIILNIPGVIVGTWLSSLLDSRMLAGYCGFANIGLAIMMLVNRNEASCKISPQQTLDKEGSRSIGTRGLELVASQESTLTFSGKFITQCSTSSFFGGFVTGFAGMGGATVTTCSMLAIGIPMRAVIGSSMFAMAITYWSSAITRAIMPGFDWMITLVLAAGASVGATLGARYQEKVKVSILKNILCAMAFFAGFQLILLLFGI